MLIVSKFRDYYDSASSFGVDKECVYKREGGIARIKLKESLGWRFFGEEARGSKRSFRLKKSYLGFCGRIYPFVVAEEEASGGKERVFFKKEELAEFMKKEGVKERKGFLFGGPSSITCRRGAQDFFEGDYSAFFGDLFERLQSPVFAVKGTQERGFSFEVEISPVLKSLEFYRVKDPHSAFQEIHMYLSGVLGSREKEAADIDDETKARQRGFGEYSFKRLPGEKKPRKRGKEKNRL